MKTFPFRLALITLCFVVLLVQVTAALAGKKEKSYGTLTGVRLVKNYDGDTITVDLKGQHPLFGDDISVRIAGDRYPGDQREVCSGKEAGSGSQEGCA